MEQCDGDDAVLTIGKDLSVQLTDNCDVIIKGCSETTGFKTAKVRIFETKMKLSILILISYARFKVL